jgi:PAS domain S-box-containing protein
MPNTTILYLVIVLIGMTLAMLALAWRLIKARAVIAAQTAAEVSHTRLYEDVRTSEGRYRTLIENANEWIWILDREGKFTFANYQAEKASGYKLQDGQGKNIAAFVLPDDLPNVQRVYAEALAGKPQTHEINVVTASGQTIVLSVNTTPLIEEGQIVSIVSFGHDITDRKKAERELERSNRELAAHNAITATISQSLDMTRVLNNILEKTLQVMQLGGEAKGGIFLVNERIGELHLAALRGLPSEFIERETVVKLDKCLCGRVVETGEIIDATRAEPWPGRPSWVEPHGHLIVPLKSKGHVLGVMFLYLPAAHRITDQEMQLLTAIGNQIGVGIENAQLYERLEAQTRNLELLYDLGRRFSASLEPKEVLAQVVHRCAQVFETSICLVHLIEDGQLVVHASHYCDDVEQAQAEAPPLARSLPVDTDLIAQVIATGDMVQFGEADPAKVASLDNTGYLQSHEWLLVPLRVKGRVLGLLTLIARRERRRFSGHDMTAAQEIANQAAAALENARLYQEAHRRLEEAELIQAVALAGAAGRPFDDIVADATERLRHLWACHHLGFLFADETGALQLHPSYVGMSPKLGCVIRIQPGQGLAGWVAQTGQPVVVPDTMQNSHYIEASSETRSEMAAPLLVDHRVIGVINVESTRPNAFSATDLQLLSALAGQLAIILDNTQAHRDLTERAQQLQDAYAELAEAEQLRDQLIQNLSHELRTPMTFVKGYVELMQEEAFGPLPPKLREPLTIVSQKTYTIERLVERIVSLQAVRPGTLTLEPLTLDGLIQEVAEHWQPEALEAGVEIALDVPSSLPPLAADHKQLTEAFDNLFSNAIKFSPKGGQVTVRMYGENGSVHVEVADTGIGIPPDKLPRVFDRFYQVDGTVKRRFGGAGVGLAIARQIVEAHGGHIWAESQGLGQGSTFHLALPVAPVSLP